MIYKIIFLYILYTLKTSLNYQNKSIKPLKILIEYNILSIIGIFISATDKIEILILFGFYSKYKYL